MCDEQVEGLMRLMEGEHVGPFNLGNPGEFTMLELAKVDMTSNMLVFEGCLYFDKDCVCLFAQVVQDTIDPNAKIEFRANTEDDPHKRKPDITKAKTLLGWEPTVSLRDGLPLMVRDFRQRVYGDEKESTGASSA